ncbi:MAG: hypothetical protein PWQ06_91 [Anaerophaga sp.]|nr:hypothetical protein [Eubacteriaceae bacterium]MDN5289852.1 hypothetical protein [Anaerophaga sp.]
MKDKTIIDRFLGAKSIEGLSKKTLAYYRLEIDGLSDYIGGSDKLLETTTDEIREYLSYCLNENGVSKCTLDNKRRILSTFYQWLEDEENIKINYCPMCGRKLEVQDDQN